MFFISINDAIDKVKSVDYTNNTPTPVGVLGGNI